MIVHKDQCYPVAEALYHLLGGKASGWTPQVVKYKGKTHWFLKHKSGFILDPTATQFIEFPYEKGKGCGFLTKKPSKRAKVVLESIGNGQ